jgi:ankyrin repeat protein
LQEIVKLLLANQCNPKAAAADDVNALHFAAQKGHVDVMRHLINAGGRQGGV